MNDEYLVLLVIWLIGVLYVVGMHYLRERTVKNLPKWVEKHPNVYGHFSIGKNECAPLFPKKILDRKIYNLVPNDVKGELFNNQFPTIAVDSEVILDTPPNGFFFDFSRGASFLLENGMSVYTVWQSLKFMSEKLGIPISKKVSHYGNDLVSIRVV
jgi:hypothetical protein